MTFNQQIQGWENYPIVLLNSVHWVDVYDLWEQLKQNCVSLFVGDPSKIKLEVSIQGVGMSEEIPAANLEGKYSQWSEETLDISTMTSFEEFLMVGGAVEDERTKFFMISRRNSYTRPKISSEMFKKLCHIYQVFPKYLHSVFQFRERHCESEEYFSGGCYRHVREDERKNSMIFEISYNIRHFEKHGRELADPWSSRQCSVYQNYCHRSNASIWILMQTPNGTKCNLERLNKEGKGSSPADHPMAIHLFLLLSCEKNWGPYIGYLGDELSLMNRSISFPKGYAEFNLNISHSQSLALLRRKLQDARSLLKSNLEIASMLSEHADEMQQQGVVLPGVNERFQSEVRQYQLRLRCHIGNVKKHLDCSEDIRLLIFKIMDFRNDELLRVNSNSLKEIADETAFENKTMVSLASKSSADLRTMRIATLIGTIYASISLVTAFFSTQLIQYPNHGEVANVKVRNEAWIYAVISVGLIVCTFVLAYIWRQRGRQPDPFIDKV